MRERMPGKGLSAPYLEEEDDDNTISISAIKNRYRQGGRGKFVFAVKRKIKWKIFSKNSVPSIHPKAKNRKRADDGWKMQKCTIAMKVRRDQSERSRKLLRMTTTKIKHKGFILQLR